MSTASQDRQGLLASLINTRHVPDNDDVLADGRALDWLLTHGADGDRVDSSTLQRVRDIREGLRQLALANNKVQPDLDALDSARTALSEVVFFVEFGGLDLLPRLHAAHGAGPARQVIAEITTAFLAERAGGGWLRIKACASPDCQWAYIDTTRNNSRRWCDMSECGNRAKNRAWRARQSDAGRRQT